MSKSSEQRTESTEKGAPAPFFCFKHSSQPVDLPDLVPRRVLCKKPVKLQDKYYLKSLHEEIDLYDHKLVHSGRTDVDHQGGQT
jgi:hypothetical protein